MPSTTSGFARLSAFALVLLQAASRVDARAPVNPVLDRFLAKHGASDTEANTRVGLAAPATFPVYTFTQPLDHFHNTGHTFEQQYWVNDRHYKAGGPVIVFEAGEGPGDERMGILDTGIIDILAKATNGLGIVLEHRYYGESVPVQNFTTDSLRWLNNEQAVADSANFIDNVTIPGIPGDITAPATPWIYWGGSYGGARAAHMRVLHPDLVFGAVASSGVVHATLDDWRYFDIIRQFAPKACTDQLVTAVREFDNLITNKKTRATIKALYGLSNVTYDPDVANVLSFPLGGWQGTNWDPAINSTSFGRFCDALGAPDGKTVTVAGGLKVSTATANYAKFINQTYSSRCRAPDTQDDCFGSITAPEQFKATDLSRTDRLWQFQVCTQWGFFMTPPPDRRIPGIISKLLTVEFSRKFCDLYYEPGEHFTVPHFPNINAVNRLGGFSIAYDRLAIIDGEADPWRGDTAHSPDARPRRDTTLRPFKVIPGGVHHWDENGLADPSQVPAFIRKIQDEEVAFVKAWLKDFKPPKHRD